MSVGGSNRGIVSEMNVVPLIDVLLVLLVIFMIIPHHQTGLRAEIPQQAPPNSAPPKTEPDIIVIQVLNGESLKINEQPVTWDSLRSRLDEIFSRRADRTAFVQGDSGVEFQVVAKVIDVMDTAGISSVGLLTPQLEKGR
ncbi:MAG: biopolymer transporter ExbD [Acidobacteria bacterium]|nr:biopolymer transporter ExbD [Acidobacteriota bacterium]